jgi:ribonuclease P protein component
MSDGGIRLRFRRTQRLQHKREFDAVYAARARVEAGPLLLHAMPSQAEPPRFRLGLSIGRRLGGAVQRNRAKRLLREAFRLEGPVLERRATPYDVVLSLRPHQELPLERYQALLREALDAADRLWTKRRQRVRTPPPTEGGSESRPEA